jgi:hypothetical protein
MTGGWRFMRRPLAAGHVENQPLIPARTTMLPLTKINSAPTGSFVRAE